MVSSYLTEQPTLGQQSPFSRGQRPARTLCTLRGIHSVTAGVSRCEQCPLRSLVLLASLARAYLWVQPPLQQEVRGSGPSNGTLQREMLIAGSFSDFTIILLLTHCLDVVRCTKG